MKTIRFTTVVDENQVIRPPSGLVIPQGELEVTVRPLTPATPPEGDPLAPTREWLLTLAAEAERAAPELPADMAERHGRTAH